ncbi:hypothetical protein B0A80_14065 [Flavobacterium tructae]|nr:hypothetical protein B0A80_14065 [Flavobacterium tructae]
MVKNKTIFFMLFCLSDANIIHFHNYITAIPAEIRYLSDFLAFHYEFNTNDVFNLVCENLLFSCYMNSTQNKKGALFPEHLFTNCIFFSR